MSKLEDNLAEVLDIGKDISPSEIVEDTPVSSQALQFKEKAEMVLNKSTNLLKLKNEEQISLDFSAVRENYYSILDQANTALTDLLNMAKDFESARFYEVCTELIEKITLINEKILELNQKQVELEKLKQFGGDTNLSQSNTQKNYFFGSTEDLRKLIMDNSN